MCWKFLCNAPPPPGLSCHAGGFGPYGALSSLPRHVWVPFPSAYLCSSHGHIPSPAVRGGCLGGRAEQVRGGMRVDRPFQGPHRALGEPWERAGGVQGADASPYAAASLVLTTGCGPVQPSGYYCSHSSSPKGESTLPVSEVFLPILSWTLSHERLSPLTHPRAVIGFSNSLHVTKSHGECVILVLADPGAVLSGVERSLPPREALSSWCSRPLRGLFPGTLPAPTSHTQPGAGPVPAGSSHTKQGFWGTTCALGTWVAGVSWSARLVPS